MHGGEGLHQSCIASGRPRILSNVKRLKRLSLLWKAASRQVGLEPSNHTSLRGHKVYHQSRVASCGPEPRPSLRGRCDLYQSRAPIARPHHPLSPQCAHTNFFLHHGRVESDWPGTHLSFLRTRTQGFNHCVASVFPHTYPALRYAHTSKVFSSEQRRVRSAAY